jgi:1-acyl-sn-glycerol-3-phosphate acyltransferase
MLESCVTALYLFLHRHRAAALACALAAVALLAALSLRVRLDQDIRLMLPQGDPLVASFYDTLSKFRPMDRLYIDVSAPRPDPAALGDAADALGARLRALEGIRDVTAAIDLDSARAALERLSVAVPGLFSDEDAAALAGKLEPERIRERLAWFKRNLAGPQGAVLKDVVRRDPVGVTDLLLAKLVPLQAGFGGARIEDGRITSADGRHVLLVAEASFPPADAGRSAGLVAEVLRAAREVEAAHATAGVSIAFTGAHRSSSDNVQLIHRDTSRNTILATAAMLLLVLASYRRWWLGAFALVPVFFGSLAAAAAVSLLFDRVSAIAVGCGSAFIGIAIDYGIQVLFHLDLMEGGDRRQEARRLGFLVVPLTIGALVTAGTFLLLAASPIPGYRQLGLFGAVGVLGALVFSLLVLPLLVPKTRPGSNPGALLLVRGFERFFAWRERHATSVAIVAAALTAACAAGLTRVTFEGNPERLNGVSADTREAETRLRNTWGDAMALTLVVTEAPTDDEVLRKDGLVNDALRALQEEGRISSYSTISSLCPSRERQAANVRRWKAFWTPERTAQARQRVAESAAALGYRPGAFDGWFEGLGAEPAPLTPADFAGTPVQRALDARVARVPSGTAVSAVAKLRDRGDIDRLRDAVRAAVPDAVVVDTRAVAVRVAELARAGLVRYLVLATALAAVVFLLLFARLALVAVSMLPLAAALVWTFGTLGILGIPIDIVSNVFVVFVLGEGYSGFLVAEKLSQFRRDGSHAGTTAGAVALCLLTTILGFGGLAFARHPALFSLGFTTSLGMTYGLLAILMLTPPAADLVLRRDRSGGTPRLRDMAGGLGVGLYLAAAQVVLFFLLGPALAVLHPRSPAKRQALLRRLGTLTFRGLLAVYPRMKTTRTGVRPEAFHPPAILVSNHQSNVDVPLLMCLPTDIRFTVKKRWWESLLAGLPARRMGHILADPENPLATLEACRQALAEGACVHIFPEGTRSPDGYLIQFHRGAFRLAVELKCDILPVAICDSGARLRPGAWWVEGGPVRLRVLPRITPQNADYAEGPGALMKRTKAALAAALQEELDRNNTPAVLRRKVARLYRYQSPLVEQYVYWKLRTDPLFEALDAAVPRSGRILDLGCGYGVVAHWLNEQTDGREILGVDYDEPKVRVARSTSEGRRHLAFETRDILEGDLPPADAALLLDVLHYITPDAQRRLLARVRQALRPGGRLVIRDMVREDSARYRRVAFWERLATRMGFNRAPQGIHPLETGALRDALREAGFARVDEIGGAGRGSNRMWVAFRD